MEAPRLFLPRGIRNHNPGNIRLSKKAWRGQAALQEDPDFVQFESAFWGLRALMRLLLTYHFKHGLDTVQSLINRYAPPAENATDQYVHRVARALRVTRDTPLNLRRPAVLAGLARAIVLHENGPPPAGHPPGWYTGGDYGAAVVAALKLTPDDKGVL